MPQPYDYFGLMGGAANIGGVNSSIQQALLGGQAIKNNQNVLDAAAREDEARRAMADIVLSGGANSAQVPGIISGYGGGTFDVVDGKIVQRTPAGDGLEGSPGRPGQTPFERLARANPQAASALQAQMSQRARLEQYFANPTPKGTFELLTQFPDLKDQISKGWDVYDGAAKDAKIAATADAYGYLQSGDAAGAIRILDQHEAADKAAGLDTSGYQQLRAAIQSSPKTGLAIAGLMLGAGAGADKFAENYGKVRETARSDELQPGLVQKGLAEASKAQTEAQYAPQTIESNLATEAAQRQRMADQTANDIATTNIAAGRLALDQQRLVSDITLRQAEIDQKYGQLSGPAEKIVNDSSAAAATAQQSASQTRALAQRFKTSGMSGSYAARGAELWKQITGSQDAYTQMRAEWAQMRNQGALANRANMPGAMSDADREFLLKGFPPDDANPAYIARWLDTMARASEAVVKQEDSKAEWVGQNGNLGPARRDIVIDGYRVPKGMTFSQQQALQRKMLPQGRPPLADDIAERARQ